MPLFISVGLQDLSFQKTTRKNKFAQRHHVRVWRTRHELPGDNRIWIAAATHETAIKLTYLPPFIVHRMNPDLDSERDHIASDLLAHDNLMAGEYPINEKISSNKPRHNPHGDKYYTDGKAKAIEII